MTGRLIKIILILFFFTNDVNSQSINEMTKMKFDSNKTLKEITKEFYNTNGQIISSITHYSDKKSTLTYNYTYNDSGDLVREVFTQLDSMKREVSEDHIKKDTFIIIDYAYNEKRQRVKKTLLGNIDSIYLRKAKTHFEKLNYQTNLSVISIENFTYDTIGQLKYLKVYSFDCDFDTCDEVTFNYEQKLLKEELLSKQCSWKDESNSFTKHYKYDKNDSLIFKQARYLNDTNIILYSYSFVFYKLPKKLIYKKYYWKNDSLNIQKRTKIVSDYLLNRSKSSIDLFESNESYVKYEYSTNGLLKSQTNYQNGRPLWKYIYVYNKLNKIVRFENYSENKNNKLKLSGYETYKYKYY
jgi:hypothetical protein